MLLNFIGLRQVGLHKFNSLIGLCQDFFNCRLGIVRVLMAIQNNLRTVSGQFPRNT